MTREEFLEVLDKNIESCEKYGERQEGNIYKNIRSLAERLEDRPKGKWNGWGECSICGYSKRQGLRPEAGEFCSNCGADMRESEVEE